MKKYLFYSLILHILLISLTFFLAQEIKTRVPAPFYARIITPEEIRKDRIPRSRKQPGPLQRKKEIKTPHIPGKLSPPIPLQTRQEFIPPKLPQDLPPPISRSSIPDSEVKAGDKPSSGGAKESGTALKQGKQTVGQGVQEVAKRGAGIEKSPTQQKTVREKLFDRDVIGKLAQKGEDGNKSAKRITLNTKGYKYYGYEQMVGYKIFDKWELPLEYKYSDIAGEVQISYTIRKNGMLGNVEIIRTSGHKSLDDAVIKAIKDGEPYWPLPDEWGEDSYTSIAFFGYGPGPPGAPIRKFMVR